tara:strand:+ start:160 stop:342 length:183 start_codon:yes stop_codon:yes gene_type:complete
MNIINDLKVLSNPSPNQPINRLEFPILINNSKIIIKKKTKFNTSKPKTPFIDKKIKDAIK